MSSQCPFAKHSLFLDFSVSFEKMEFDHFGVIFTLRENIINGRHDTKQLDLETLKLHNTKCINNLCSSPSYEDLTAELGNTSRLLFWCTDAKAHLRFDWIVAGSREGVERGGGDLFITRRYLLFSLVALWIKVLNFILRQTYQTPILLSKRNIFLGPSNNLLFYLVHPDRTVEM